MVSTREASPRARVEPTLPAVSAFRLEIGRDRLATLTFDVPGKKVNVFNREVLEELESLIDEVGKRTDIGCLILVSGKDHSFIAGADVGEIAGVTDPAEAEAASRFGQRVFAAWEALPFPTVAAIGGTCVGGGTELALASTFRLVMDDPDLRIGLPEIRLGILPGWGGSTRLPRRIGLAAALDIILAGKTVRARKAFKVGLADALLPAAGFLGHVRDFALERRGQGRRDGKLDLKELLLERNPLGRKLVFEQARKQVLEQTGGNYPAPLRALEVVRTGVEEGSRAGFDAEARAVGELATSPISKNLIHVFHLTEAAKKAGGVPGGSARGVGRAAVLGAGAMGGGIAQLIAHEAGIPVRMKDIAEEALASGMEHAGRLFSKLVEKHRLTEPEARRKMTLLHPTLDYGGLRGTDLVIEAVVEKLEIKQVVFAETAAHLSEDAVLASNTSSLSIARIAEKTPHPERVVGMHFFNPVHRMPLVEVITAEGTSPDAAATVYAFARRLGKTPVVVRDTPGFLVNRLLMFYSVEALWLLEDGYGVEDVDRAMKRWGMPMGPLALTDEVGIDVAVKVAHILHDAFGERLPLPVWLDRLVEDGRLGKKNGRGIYRYEGRKRKGVDPEALELLGLERRKEDPDPRSLVERMVYPMVDEAARCLEEGVVASPGELDLALILGTGFPPFRGGLCRWADEEGPTTIAETLKGLATSVGDRYAPSEALESTAAAGGFYARS